jgi:hypothetical protein
MAERNLSDHIPHAGEELNKATIAKSEADNDVGGCETSSAEVDQAEDKGCQGESTETKRCGIGEFATLDTLVETRLKFTAECWQSGYVACAHVSERAIAEFGSGSGSPLLLVRHVLGGFFDVRDVAAILIYDSGVTVGSHGDSGGAGKGVEGRRVQ